MIYGYDRIASGNHVDFLKKYVQQARLFPPILKRIADALKTPDIGREASKIETRIEDVERLTHLLDEVSDENKNEALSLVTRLAKEEDRDPIDWAQEGYIGGTGLWSRLETLQPEGDFEEVLEGLIKSLRD